jgi:hypothetical protein
MSSNNRMDFLCRSAAVAELSVFVILPVGMFNQLVKRREDREIESEYLPSHPSRREQKNSAFGKRDEACMSYRQKGYLDNDLARIAPV